MQKQPKHRQAGSPGAARLCCMLLLAVLATACLGASAGQVGAGNAAGALTAAGAQITGGLADDADAGYAADTATPLALGNNPFAFRLRLNGQVLALPAPVADLLAAGWEAALPADALLPAQTTLDTTLTLEGWEIAIQLANLEAEALPWQACSVIRLALEEAASPTIELPGGFGWRSGLQALLEACGVLDKDATDTTLSYTTSPQSGLAFTFDTKGLLVGLAMWNRTGRPAPPLATTLPPELLAYTPPAALSGDWRDFTVAYAGVLYTLPAPVAAFLENGWTLRDSGEVPAAGSLMRVCLQKGTQVLRTTLHNYSAAAQPLEGCFVTMVESTPMGANLPLALPGGVTEASGLAEIEAAWGPATEVDRTGYNTRDYYWLAGAGQVVVRVERSEERVVDLEVWHAPGSLPDG